MDISFVQKQTHTKERHTEAFAKFKGYLFCQTISRFSRL